VMGVLLALTLALYYRGLRLPSSSPREPRDMPTLVMLAVIGAMLLVTGIIAASTPTNTWDCLVYHLPRQFMWMQQHSVAHYPAGDLRQLEMPPFTEFAGVNMWILSGVDRWGNLIQWAALGLTAVAASLVVLELGMGRRAQALAALLVVCNPAAAVQATNGKNDIVVALWAVMLFYLAVRIWRLRRFTAVDALIVGTTLGLSLLTKGTSYIYAFPSCLFIGFGMLRASGHLRLREGVETGALPNREGVRALGRMALLGAALTALAMAINAGHWVRNYRAFESPITVTPEKGGYQLYNQVHSAGALASNLLRNATIHTSLPERIPNFRGGMIELPKFKAANQAQMRGVERIHAWMGQDANAPETTMRTQPYRVQDTWWHDGNNPAPMYLVLGAVVVIAAILRPRRILAWTAPPALLIPFAAMALFAFLLCWQPWHARLHIAGISLLAPVAAAVVSQLRWYLFRGALVAGTVLLSWPGLVLNQAKPMHGTNSIFRASGEAMRWQYRLQEMVPVMEAATALREFSPRVVALETAALPGNYSVQWTVRRALGEGGKIRQFIRKWGPDFAEDDPGPDAVLSWPRFGAPARIRDQRGRVYSAAAQRGPTIVYLPGERVERSIRFIGWNQEAGLFRAQGRTLHEMFRWGHGERTSLQFVSGGEPMVVVMDVKTSMPGQVVTVRLNGEEVKRIELPVAGGFRESMVEISPLQGTNELVLEYAAQESQGAPPGRTVLYQKLQILPLVRPPVDGQ
jgi:hypothetical protein